MKKIIIVNNNLHIGGVQKALVNLLREIEGKYDITVALFNPSGELLNDIPKRVKIMPIYSDYRYLGLTKHDVHGKKMLKFKRSIYAIISRIFGRNIAVFFMALGQKKINGYDVAISYIQDGADRVFYGGCNDFVLRHIDAPKKITFLHCDYRLCGANTQKNQKRYKKFDIIAACSKGCCNSFLKELPGFKNKVRIVYNCYDYDMIKDKAKKAIFEFEEQKINIITVARFGKEKAVHRAIEAIGKSNIEKAKIHYYIIGDGIEKAFIEEKIRIYGLEKQITLLGELDNPYPYIKAADLLLISSYSEAAPMVIGEAAILGTPILSTETSSAKEMIMETGIGWVCDNSLEGLINTLSMIINDKKLIEDKKKEIKRQHFNNTIALEQFDDMISHK